MNIFSIRHELELDNVAHSVPIVMQEHIVNPHT
ncbi:hypothetical protein F383_14417 [Gossypium arboreum]|uniref:Uncharacterized protein n=1 Tax=Gossypium arboreum TaxID=29729 RepID=A0A0B0PVH9_GOSAR|nr:hypothetical protein F383_18105 [Gossypium arboreum]KHG29025.1 hypothetical protein F383_14417 [Gossypium arboreum]